MMTWLDVVMAVGIAAAAIAFWGALAAVAVYQEWRDHGDGGGDREESD